MRRAVGGEGLGVAPRPVAGPAGDAPGGVGGEFVAPVGARHEERVGVGLGAARVGVVDRDEPRRAAGGVGGVGPRLVRRAVPAEDRRGAVVHAVRGEDPDVDARGDGRVVVGDREGVVPVEGDARGRPVAERLDRDLRRVALQEPPVEGEVAAVRVAGLGGRDQDRAAAGLRRARPGRPRPGVSKSCSERPSPKKSTPGCPRSSSSTARRTCGGMASAATALARLTMRAALISVPAKAAGWAAPPR